jgi:murein DD-endopeptidase MepM/ murein hydrolase activator NlpD
MADQRRLSVILVPDDGLETRTYEISYRRLKVLMGVGGVLLTVFIVMVASWWFIATQAARVRGLERELAQLEAERAQVAQLAQDLARAEQQYERVRNLLGVEASDVDQEVALPPLRGMETGAAADAGESNRPSSWPLARAGFITQRRQVTDAGSHPGLDIAVPADSYIRATASGVVRDAGVDDVYGRFVLIDHGNGFESMYGHASRVFVATGDAVERNEVIALSGSTGRSTAPHLHFEIRQDGQAVDPLGFVRQPS